MNYEAKLAIDLCEWTYEVLLESPSKELKSLTRKIPSHEDLHKLAVGAIRYHVTVGEDKVFLPKEIFETLLWEILSCQALIRRTYGEPLGTGEQSHRYAS